jgi:GNAT superfamily N-acetyltransferase
VVDIERRRLAGGREAREFGEIYEASFPADERDDTAVLVARILDGERDCYLATGDDQLLGFAVVLPLEGYPVAFLEYLAVASAARNGGIGSHILKRMRRDLAATSDGTLFEVDPPQDADDGGERDLRERRIAFYQRNGAALVAGGMNYRAPSPAGKGTLPYLLMWLPTAPGGPAPAGSYLKACVTAMFAQSYELDTNTPAVRELIARIE